MKRLLSTLQPHWDLPSFISYVKSTNPSNTSAAFQGVLYEYTVQHTLAALPGMSEVIRCGQAGDNGIDIMTRWDLRQLKRLSSKKSKYITLLMQCKSSRSKVSGRVFRELEGAYKFHIANTKDSKSTVMMVASPANATSQGLAQFEATDTPMVLARIDKLGMVYDRKREDYDMEPFEDAKPLKSLLCNYAATRMFSNLGVLEEVNALSETKTGVDHNQPH